MDSKKKKKGLTPKKPPMEPKPIWEIAVELGSSIPKEELARLPRETHSLVYGRKLKKKQESPPIWDVIEEISRSIPESDLENLSHDGSINYKHYLYGFPKVEE